MRDLVALSTLPVVWAGYQPLQVAESLAEVLLSMLHLDLVYLRLPRQTNGHEIEIARTTGGSLPPEETRVIGRALQPWLDGAGIAPAQTIPNPAGAGTVRLVVVLIGCGEQAGALVAGSRRTTFPGEADRLFLTVGVNQAAAVFQHLHAKEALRASEQRFRTFVDHAADAFFLHEEGTSRVLDVNRRACESLGYTRDELLGMTPFDFDPDLTPALLEDRVHKIIVGETVAFETRHRRKDGTVFPVEVRSRAFLEGDRQFFVSFARDITERKRAEEALRQSEALFRDTFENAAVGIDHVDLEGRFLSINQKFCEILGYTREEIVTKTWMELTHPDDLAADLELYGRLLRGELASYTIEKRFIRSDRSTVWVDLTVSFHRDAAGRPSYCIAIFQDISERKRLEQALTQASARLDLAIRASNVGLWEIDMPDGDYAKGLGTWINVWEQLGLDPPEDRSPHSVWLDLLHPDDKECTVGTIMAYLDGQTKDFEVEYRVRHNDGIYRWMLSRGTAIRDERGSPVRFVGTRVDITELKRVEAALRTSEARFRTLAEALPTMVWTAQPDGTIDYINARHIEYIGLTLEQLRGRDRGSTVHPEDWDRCIEQWTRSVATGELYKIEYRCRRADGVFRWHLGQALPLRDESGQVTKWFGSITDIDDQKRAALALREAKEAAEAASRAKDEFLANVSHEIRTPMNAILGMTELALDTLLTAEQREYLAIVKSSADALLRVINDVLDFAKIEAGKLELDYADFSLRHVLGETLRALAFRAHRKGLELVCSIPPEVPDALIGDAGRLRQVLLNLVGNAIKFTEDGEVVVRVEAGAPHGAAKPAAPAPGSPPSQVLRFAISDTGIGIPREKQERIFQAFEQVDSSTTRRYEGTGLGLSIAARLVDLMGGQITVDSAPGRGSTFRFTAEFGVHLAPPGAPHERPLADLHGLRVLVVDDNATNRQILEEWLRAWHTEPLAVAGGLQALDELWSAVSIGQPFALVLLDVRMPGVDGLAVAERILQNPVLSACRIILLTSDDLRSDIARYRALGIAACAMKPVQQEELLETIHRVLSRPDSSGGARDRRNLAEAVSTAVAPSPAARRLRILVAEDNPFNQQHVEHLLRRRRHEVRVASDGRQALAALEQDRFDLMLLDLHMPGCDGFEVIEALRRREQATGGHLPVIALTARAMKSDRERCMQAGMDDYLAKPIGAAELFAVLDRVLAGRPGSGPPGPSPPEHEDIVDPDTLLAACDNDPVLLGKLIRVFLSNVPGSLSRVERAIARQDPAQLRESAHQLRGLISTFSPKAAQAASELEAMGAGGELGEAASTLRPLANLIERLGPILENLPIDELRRAARRPHE
jgi:two-component system, sensor histidine kinase and response regulator